MTFLVTSRLAARLVVTGALAVLAVAVADGARAGPLVNGDFETGSLAPWSQALIGNGEAGAATVTAFDVTGLGPSLAAQFQIGTNVLGTPGGKRVFQAFDAAVAGLYTFGVDVASFFFASSAGQVDGGTYTLAVDGTALASFIVGPLAAGQVVRAHLAGDLALASGSHVFEVDMTRNYVIPNSSTLLYFDNAFANAVGVVAVPEPATWALLALGVGATIARRRVR